MSVESEVGQQREQIETHRTLWRSVRIAGGVAVAGGLVTLCSLPWIIDARKWEEKEHALDAREDMLNAVLAQTGSTAIDHSFDRSVFLQDFQDTDLIAVPTGDSNPEAARTFVRQAAAELDGTYKNQLVSNKLSELQSGEYPDTPTLVEAYNSVRVDIVNGDMISWRDVEIGAGAIGLSALGVLMLGKYGRQEHI